jgi:hypothetical protein
MRGWIGHRKRCTHEFKIELSGELKLIILGIPGIINITYFFKMSSVFLIFFGFIFEINSSGSSMPSKEHSYCITFARWKRTVLNWRCWLVTGLMASNCFFGLCSIIFAGKERTTEKNQLHFTPAWLIFSQRQAIFPEPIVRSGGKDHLFWGQVF